MQIVEVTGFDSVREALDLIALRQPQWFPERLQGVQAVANAGFFAALDRGTLYISTAEWPDLAFAPARELMSALADIKAGRPLSFKQEYAVEVLQHELVHHAFPLTSAARVKIGADAFEECLVQLTARLRYPALLRTLGAEAAHDNDVLLNGYAYTRGTRNLVDLMRVAGLSVEDLETALRSDAPRAVLQQRLARALGISHKKAGWLLTQAGTKPLEDFRAKVAQAQAYAQRQGKE